jgi:hypothetical protein
MILKTAAERVMEKRGEKAWANVSSSPIVQLLLLLVLGEKTVVVVVDSDSLESLKSMSLTTSAFLLQKMPLIGFWTAASDASTMTKMIDDFYCYFRH